MQKTILVLGTVVSAYGDLDCDGTYSTYSLTGMVTEDGDISLGEIRETDPLE